MPKKSLGQNFLRDPKILSKIADFAEIKNTDTVIEVGPGEGTLTEILLQKTDNVIAIEKDDELAKSLLQKFNQHILNNKLRVINQDILNYEPDVENYILVGNIPYYITGAIFKKFLESKNPPKSMTFVIQKEVADRIMARDGKESILSISIKTYGEPKYGGTIKAGSFYPKPNVDSAIISITGISKEKFSLANPSEPSSLSTDKSLLAFSSSQLVSLRKARSEGSEGYEKKFFEILKTGFAHKRKLLIKNLGEIAGERNLKEIFKKCGIEEKTRAEDLKVGDWINLTHEF